jgi:peroxiredoxin Q/BCP
MIEKGDEAPDFVLPDQAGRLVRLSDLRGKTIVLYFYPKADTPGCTTQACGIRDHRNDYESAGAVVLGVSADPVKAVSKFDQKYNLGFPLLSDEDHAVSEQYGTWVEKSMYGRKYMGVQRSTFVIDAEGKIAHVMAKANPKTHDAEVLKMLGELDGDG